MTYFTITEDFPKSEIEFDKHFQNRKPVSITCSSKNGVMALSAKNAGIRSTG